jgi:Fe-S cluster biogenesis protein NfuA/nitrite reductase/ring-hydroxylating ferredoxin subunit
MAVLVEDQEVRARVANLEALLERIEALADPKARSLAAEAVQALLELYGEGLARIMASVDRVGAHAVFQAFAQDELVSHLLLLHGLHPVDVETRVREALEEVRPYLASHGGNVELMEVEDGVARVRLQGSCKGCPSSTMTLKLAIEEAILKAAPDVDRVEAEGVVESSPPPPSNFIPFSSIQGLPSADPWTVIGGLPQLSGGGVLFQRVSDQPVLFLRLGTDLYAYRSPCPGCGDSLEQGSLSGVELTCPGCGHRYDVRRAGTCLDAQHLHLEPVPLLVEPGGMVKVAMSGGR